MASSKDYLEFILEQLPGSDDISYRAMMGEFIIYYRGKVVGGIYDDRFLVKTTKSALTMMPNADMEVPYEGAKEMILVDDVENREFLGELLEAMYKELPAPKKKKRAYESKRTYRLSDGADPVCDTDSADNVEVFGRSASECSAVDLLRSNGSHRDGT